MDLTNTNNGGKRRRKNSIDLATMIYGKVPPQAKDLEEAILGIMMLQPDCGYEIKNILNPDDFYVEAHIRICKTIFEILDMHGIPDILSVAEALRKKEELEMVGGAYYVTKLTNSVVGSGSNIRWSRIIKQKSILRKVIRFSGIAVGLAYEDSSDPFDVLDEIERELFAINEDIESSRAVSLDFIAVSVSQGHSERLAAEGNPEKEKNYLRSGIRSWDVINGYFRPPGVYVVAARPGMGKTDFLIQIICNVATHAEVGFVSAEMSDEEICQRCICNLAELDNYMWTKPSHLVTDDDNNRFMQGMKKFVELKLHIESRTNRIDRITSKMKFWVKKCGVRIILIDFLQILIVAEETNRYMTEVQSLNYILEAIRTTAKELGVPVVLLSQLNRELYKRGNKEPGLSDLKGSGKIEEIAYQISFLHRPEYYELTVDDMGESTLGLMVQMILKNRGGMTGRINHQYVPKFSKIMARDTGWLGGFNPVNTPFGQSGGWQPFKDSDGGAPVIFMGGKLNSPDDEPPVDDTPF